MEPPGPEDSRKLYFPDRTLETVFIENQFVDIGIPPEYVSNPLFDQEGDKGIGIGLSHSPDRGRCHDCVTYPVYSPDEYFFSVVSHLRENVLSEKMSNRVSGPVLCSGAGQGIQ